jgi:hypothetical protein
LLPPFPAWYSALALNGMEDAKRMERDRFLATSPTWLRVADTTGGVAGAHCGAVLRAGPTVSTGGFIEVRDIPISEISPSLVDPELFCNVLKLSRSPRRLQLLFDKQKRCLAMSPLSFLGFL